MLRPCHYTDGKITEQLITDLKSKHEFKTSSLFNTFENVAFAHGEELAKYHDYILKIGAPNVHLAGSGPSLFTLLEEKAQAEDLLLRLKNHKMEAYLTDTRNGL
jgi:4-diphosphocytidyl-2-C-methyl-D-erythritol kinase